MFEIASVETDQFLAFFQHDSFIATLAIVCGSLIAIIAIVFGVIRGIATTKAREATKREIAAYVAEGSIDPDKAVALLEADKPVWEKAKASKSPGRA